MHSSLMDRAGWISLILALTGCGGSDVPAGPGAGGSSGATTTATGTTGSTGSTQGASSSTNDTSSTVTGGSGSGSSSFTTGQGTTGSVDTTGQSSSTTGCTGGAGGGGAGGGENDGGMGPADAPIVVGNGIVLPYSSFPPIGTGTSGTSGSSGTTVATTTGGGIDPNTQYLIVGTTGFTCAKPFNAKCGAWQVTIGVPPTLFKVGAIPLCDPSLISNFSEADQDPGGGNCGGGGGSFTAGTLEIVSMTNQSVIFRLSNTSKLFGLDADGTYLASRCQ